jgi:hypothetical protein
MLPLPSDEVIGGLILLFLFALPLGFLILRGGEWFVGRRLALSVPERTLLAFYASGSLLFCLASLPLPIYGLPLVDGLLIVGGIGVVIVSIFERCSGVRKLGAYLRTWPALTLVLGSLGLLLIEVASSMVALPNGVDGSVYALYVNLILRNHTLPWTLAPYSTVGVVYPQGAPVWMTVPTLLFGWPIVSAPVTLPPLFLSFSAAAGFCLGERVPVPHRSKTPWMGLLFAGFFGLLASWPRLYVGGSYDFIFALPVFLVALGFLAPFAAAPKRSWREVIAFGILLGSITALSAAVGTTLILLAAVYVICTRDGLGRNVIPAVATIASIIGVSALFVCRSLIGLAIWFDLPGHVLVDAGSPPYALPSNAQVYGGAVGLLDPFVPWKSKISPIPVLSIEIQALFAAGLVLAGVLVITRSQTLSVYIPKGLARWVTVGTVTVLAETIVLLAWGSLDTSLSGVQSITNLWETSILLFTFFALVSALPLIFAMEYTFRQLSRQRPKPPEAQSSVRPVRRRPRTRSQTASWHLVMVSLLLIVPLGSGLGATVVFVPPYLHNTISEQANATQADISALEWAGAHLPGCSRVLVAPGSAAQFLPEYAEVELIFPVFPTPINLSYHVVVTNLTDGTYNDETRSALLALDVTEIFVTGRTTTAFSPFEPAPLDASSDFQIVYEEQDAIVFAFLLGISSTGCAPT